MSKNPLVRSEGTEGDSDLGSEMSASDALSDDGLDGFFSDEDEGCGEPEERDVVDDALEQVIEILVDAGYDDEDAEDAVWSALEQLHDCDDCSDTPDLEEPEEKKLAWIYNTIPKLKAKLKEMGLDF